MFFTWVLHNASSNFNAALEKAYVEAMKKRAATDPNLN